MNGDVGTIGSCDAILCPTGTFAPSGRQVSKTSHCTPCDGLLLSNILGNTYCRKIDSERGILNLLYAKCGGSSWKSSKLWTGDEPICSWEGIKCDGDKDDDEGVISIDLEDSNLQGTLPDLVWSLPRMRTLNLRYNNDLHVSVHGMSSAAGTLEELELYGVKLDSLDGISKASKLKELDFSGMTGVLPDELFDLKNLERLYISDNSFVGSFPAKLVGLKSLRRFHAKGNDFHGPLPHKLGSLSYLQELGKSRHTFVLSEIVVLQTHNLSFDNAVLDENLISGTIPDTLSYLKHLSRLSVSRTTKSGRKLTGSLPRFDRMPELLTLDLKGNELTGTIPKRFLSASLRIQTVDLSHNRLTGAVPARLDSLANLNLVLTENEISGLPKAFCDNADWMGGQVGKQGGCDAILCPPATFNSLGRITNETTSCTTCDGMSSSAYYGSTTCEAPANERQVLTDFFHAADGDHWHRNDFWATPTDVCDWYGVGCIHGRVVLLNLQNNNVAGQLDQNLFSLPMLQVLWLGVNPLEISFANIGRAENLLELRIQATEIKSLQHLGNATSLTVLDAHSNSLRGPFPQEVLGLPNLRLLDMRNNQITGAVPSLETMVHLRILRLHNNQLSGPLPSFSSSAVLSDIDLSENRLDGTVPADFLSRLPPKAVVRVDVSGNDQIAKPIPTETFARFHDAQIHWSGGESLVKSSAPAGRSHGPIGIVVTAVVGLVAIGVGTLGWMV